MQSKSILLNTNEEWNPKRRYKVNSVVTRNSVMYQNSTGQNSAPELGIDWFSATALSIPPKLKRIGDGVSDSFDIGTIALVKQVFYESVMQDGDVWNQSGSTISFNFIPETGKSIQFL